MKAMMGGGLCLVLAVVSTQSFAEELQFRPAGSTLGRPTPVRASGVTPASFTAAPAQASGISIGLGRPTALSNLAEERVDLDRPSPLIRGQAADVTMQPLPVGQPGKQDSSRTISSSTTQAGRLVPIALDPEYVSPMPRVMQGAAVSDSCGCGVGMPIGTSGATAILDGGGMISGSDCGCGCFNDCGCGCGDGCDYRGRRFYASAAYLGWTFERKNIPPLVTVSPTGTPIATTGVLGQPTTSVLFGQDNQESAYHSGGRFNLGVWLPCDNWALEVDYFFLGQNSVNANFASDANGSPQIGRPVVIGGQETVQFVSQPGIVTGSASVNSYSQMWGIELNARQKLCCGPSYWIDMLYGYRHLDLAEGINIGENLVQAGNPSLGIAISDQFHTRNVFNGGQVGIQGEWNFWPRFPRFFLGGSLKVAMGDMREQVNINGSTAYTFLPNTPAGTFNTGILAASSNSGNQQADRFAVIPEMNLKLGFEINDHWRVWAGYDFLYASSVVRPGDQIDRRVNPSQLPLPNPVGAQPLVGVAQPAPLFRTTSFYAQGVSCGLQYRW